MVLPRRLGGDGQRALISSELWSMYALPALMLAVPGILVQLEIKVVQPPALHAVTWI